ncbi:transglutaminase-like domain-containing protein [Humidisolicoccus flavus]|uniref:transglutaminase-like domain-containing protein n=1 Tax=Humidisolicoccus flavus TaxID=3111414 RepID=UPI00324E1A30
MNQPQRPWKYKAIDLAVIFVLFFTGVVAFGPVFGSINYLIAGIGGVLLGIAVGVITSLPKLRGVLTTAAGIVIAFLLFGPVLAVRHETIGLFIPTLEGLRELLLGVVFSWKGLLTAQPPAEGFPSLLIVPYLSALVLSTISTAIALRTQRLAPLAVLPPIFYLVIGIAFGTKFAAFPTWQAIVFAVAAMSWISWRQSQWRKSLAAEVMVNGDDTNRVIARRNRFLGSIAMLAGAALLAGVVSIPINPTNRNVLRDNVEPPVEIQDYPSPLAGFRNWVKNFEDEALFAVTGMPEGTRVRLATLDYFDGTVYSVAGSESSSSSGTFSRIGDSVDVQSTGVQAELQFEIMNYSGIWMPSAGFAESISFNGSRSEALRGSLHYNGSTGTAIVLDGLQDGDQYSVQAVVPVPPSQDQLEDTRVTNLSMPKPVGIPDYLQAWATEHGTTENTVLGNIQSMTRELTTNGFFSNGVEGQVTSLAGHGSARLDDMMRAPQLIGDDEQYSTVLSLALHWLGIPNRVVLGFYPEGGFEGEGTSQLVGGDIHAWVEVPFEGYGWVPFDPTPPEDQQPTDEVPQPQPNPKPQVLQPPQPPEEPAELTPRTQAEQGSEEEEREEASTWYLWLLWITTAILILLILALLPFLIVGALKARRRKKRREAIARSDRLSGGWHEVVDAAVDLGLDVPVGVTRREVASVVGQRYPNSQATAIGDYVDEGVFGLAPPPEAEITAFWEDIEVSIREMRAEAGRRQRLRSRLSLRSFRRGAGRRGRR